MNSFNKVGPHDYVFMLHASMCITFMMMSDFEILGFVLLWSKLFKLALSW